MFRGRILGTSKSRDPQHTQDLPFDPPVHAMFSLSAPAIPALIVLGVPPGLTRAERIASILSAFKHSATPPPGAAIHAVCTDGDVLEVYRLEGSTLSLAHDMAIEYGTPTAYARGMEQGA